MKIRVSALVSACALAYPFVPAQADDTQLGHVVVTATRQPVKANELLADVSVIDRSQIERAAAYLGIAGGFHGFYDYVLALRAELNVPANLTAMGIANDRIDELSAMAIEDPSAGGNPVKMTLENTKQLFADCF